MTAVLLAAPSVSGLNLAFNYTFDANKFFINNPAARETLERAGAFYSHILTDSLSAITPGGGNSWDLRFTHPTTGQAAYDPVSNPGGFRLFDVAIPQDTVVVYVGARNLPSGGLASATLGTSGSTGGAAWQQTVTHRGQAGVTAGNNADEIAPWGGSMTFDLDDTWNFDWQAYPLAGQNDLYSVALHELAHVLGLGTADSWYSQVTGGAFAGTATQAANGGTPPTVAPGAGHWGAGVTSVIYQTPSPQEASLDPDILRGARKLPTDLDIAGLDDLGWDIAPPVPGDYDYDGTLDGDDIDELFANFGSAAAYNRARFNSNGDAVIDQADADHWIEVIAGTSRGDANLNGQVEQGDLDAVLYHWGLNSAIDPDAVVSWRRGDVNGNGAVEQGDLDDVLQHWGSAGGPAVGRATVPEPQVVVGLAVLLLRCRGTQPVVGQRPRPCPAGTVSRSAVGGKRGAPRFHRRADAGGS